MRTELVLSTFDASWPELCDAAQRAEAAGVARVWIMDHLSGEVHDRSRVLECWTTLAGLATATTTIGLGSLVTNVVIRNPVLLANSASTVQEQSAGRLVVGLGAGGGPGTPYDDELRRAGLPHGESAGTRRLRVEEVVDALGQVWSGSTSGVDGEHVRLSAADGYLRPDPPPGLLIAGYGRHMAELAGRCADGFNTSADNPDLSVCCDAVVRGRSEVHRPDGCELSVWAVDGDESLTPGRLDELARLGVSVLMLIVAAPFTSAAIEAAPPVS